LNQPLVLVHVVDAGLARCRRQFFAWPARNAGEENAMNFDERIEGDFRIYAGALEGPKGDGYIAAVVVNQIGGAANTPREVYRDETLACGHRWASASAALLYAVNKARQVISSGRYRLA
jgi:hypothetical protein